VNVKNLGLRLHTQHGVAQALSSLSLTIERGETFALVGESGCGKSMTALAMMRLLPNVAQIHGGQVLLGEQDLFELSEREMQVYRGKRISIIFQEPATSLNPVMSIGDQLFEVILPVLRTQFQGGNLREMATLKAIEWLKRVGIAEPERRLKQFPFEFSGGQLQRVMIAIALAAEPDVLIADEPTTALDVTLQAQILDLLKSLQKDRRMALLLITHDLAVVKGMADHVALMYAGEVVEVATQEQFFAHPAHPYAQMLLNALPSTHKRGHALQAIVGQVPPLSQAFQGCRFEARCPYVNTLCQIAPVGLSPLPSEPSHSVRCIRVAEGGLEHVSKRSASLSTPLQQEPLKASELELSSSALSAEPLLKVNDLCVSYDLGGGWLGSAKRFEAVRGVSFEIHKGQTLALVGESGCGKSTLGKALVQVLGKSAKITGEVVLNGQTVFSQPVKKTQSQLARESIQIIFQNPFASLNPRMRVQEILEEGMKSLHPEWSKEQRAKDLRLLLDRVGLRREALQLFPHEFSGGQRQRIAIARALAVKPALIVCDEPTSALDVSIQAQILNLLRELKDELGVSYLFITHNLGVVSYLADQVAVMHEGQIIEMGECQELINNPKESFTRTLLEAVPVL
jgi:peptide/nickel transport system ATP-binding protein